MESDTDEHDPWVETAEGLEVQYYRADGNMICQPCGQEYFRHPYEASVVGYDELPFLHRICNGDLVKL